MQGPSWDGAGPPPPSLLQLPSVVQSDATACTDANTPCTPLFHLLLASAVSSVWRTCCFSGSLGPSRETPRRCHVFSGDFPRSRCKSTALCAHPYRIWLYSEDQESLPWALCSKTEKAVPAVRSCLGSWLTAQVLSTRQPEFGSRLRYS